MLDKYIPKLIAIKEELLDEPDDAGRAALETLENLLREAAKERGLDISGDTSTTELVDMLTGNGFIREQFLHRRLKEICSVKKCLYTSRGFFMRPKTALLIVTSLETLIKHNATKAYHLISNNPITVDISDTLGYAKEIMLERGFSQLPVMDGIRILGTISLKGLLSRMKTEERKWKEVKLKEIMEYIESPNIIPKDTDIDRIIKFFTEKPYGMLIVTETGEQTSKLVGVITASDIAPLL